MNATTVTKFVEVLRDKATHQLNFLFIYLFKLRIISKKEKKFTQIISLKTKKNYVGFWQTETNFFFSFNEIKRKNVLKDETNFFFKIKNRLRIKFSMCN